MLELGHVVITSVTRDDLPDGGAQHFAATIHAVRELLPSAGVEVLVPDFGGSTERLELVMAARPDVLNHNVETVSRLYPRVRPQADYARSLGLLADAGRMTPSSLVKSGFMVGLGEDDCEIEALLRDLREAGVSAVTIGQYLQPTRRHLPVERYVAPEEFERYAATARRMGFAHVLSGPLVRSSYHAADAAGIVGRVDTRHIMSRGSFEHEAQE
jgi:lipoic acid synthetase